MAETQTKQMAHFNDAPGFKITRTGLQIKGQPTFEEAEIFGRQLATLEHATQWAIGKFVIWLEEHYGELASQIIDESYGWNVDSLKVYKWVHEKVSEDVRQESLSFQHHKIVAGLPPAQQKSWLAKAAKGDEDGVAWPTSRLSAAIRNGHDTAVTSCWLLVRCKDQNDRSDLQVKMHAEGRATKEKDQREPKPKKAKADKVTARAKSPKKKTARSKG
jgi:hypothetical protein